MVQAREDHGWFPESWYNTKYDGIFVVDGFDMIKGPESWQVYMAEILFDVWKATNTKCLAVVVGGASFGKGSGKGSYFHMLAVIRANFARPRFMVWICMANDLYPLHRRQPRQSFLSESTTRLLQVAARWVPEQRMVFGGDAGVWGYRESFSQFACGFYDMQCNMVTQYARREGFSCLTGRNIFMDMVLTDRIGHVSAESMPILIEGFRILTKWGSAKSEPASRL